MPINKVLRTTTSMHKGTTPSYVVPDNGSRMWSQLSSRFGQMADDAVAEEQFQRGVAEQTKAYEDAATNNQPITNIAEGSSGWGISSKAYAKGANEVFTLQKKAELDNAFLDYSTRYKDKPQEFKDNWNKTFLPNFFKTIPTNQQAGFRLEATERFNRVVSQMNAQALKNSEQAAYAETVTRLDNLKNELFQSLASGQNVNPSTGKTSDDLIAEMTVAIGSISDRNAPKAIELQRKIQQTIRQGEYEGYFNRLSRDEQKQFLSELENFQFDATQLKGETLTPEAFNKTVGRLKAKYNAATQTDNAELARVKAELAATEKALVTGNGTERDHTVLLSRAAAVLKPEQIEQWTKRITRADTYGEDLNAYKALPLPAQTARLLAARTEFEATQNEYNNGRISSDEFFWEKTKYEGLTKAVSDYKKLINDDSWNALQDPNAPQFDLTSEDGIYEARNWISQKTGIAIYSVPPLSKPQLTAQKDDILETNDPVERAGKLQALRNRLGDRQFEDVFRLMQLDGIYANVAYASTPQNGANIVMVVNEGDALLKRADSVKKDGLITNFNSRMGNALAFDAVKRAQMQDAFLKLALAYETRGADDPSQLAFDAVTTGKQVITLENGQKRLVPDYVNEAQLNAAIADVKRRWPTLGVMLPRGVLYSDTTLDKFSPQIVGNKLMFVSPNKVPLKVRGQNADRPEILQINLDNYELGQPNPTEDDVSVWDGPTLRVANATGDASDALAKLFAANQQKLAANDSYDTAADRITNKPYERQQLQAFVAVIRGGKIPNWAYDFMGKFDELDVNNTQRFKKLQTLWEQHDKTKFLTGGARATPIELLMDLVLEVRQIPFDPVAARKAMTGR